MKNFLLNLQFIFRPSYWVLEGEGTYSQEWNDTLNALLDKYEFSDVRSSTAQLGPALLYTLNHRSPLFGPKHPYFSLYDAHCSSARPSRLTMVRACKALRAAERVMEEQRIAHVNKGRSLIYKKLLNNTEKS